ncbi:MAG: hypothetical protein P8O23_05935, partial [Opitutales bacterium]|nr:hypothetical protein [Opitutales bacterium]
VLEKGSLDSNFDIRQILEKIRSNSLNYGLDSIDINGIIETNEFSLPFSLFASYSEPDRLIKAAIELRFDELFPTINQFFPIEKKLLFHVQVQREDVLGTKKLRISIRNKKLGMLSYLHDGESELIEFYLGRNQLEMPRFELMAKRGVEENQFTGDWNSTLHSQHLMKPFPVFSLINTTLQSAGQIKFDIQGNDFELEGEGNFSVSSFFLPQEGTVSGQINGRIRVIDEKWTVENFRIWIENKKGERVEAGTNLSFTDLREIKNVNLLFRSLDVGRLKEHFTDGTRLSGNFLSAVNEGVLSLTSSNLQIKHNDKIDKDFNVTVRIPLFPELNQTEDISFKIEHLSEKLPPLGFVPEKFSDSNQISFQKVELQGVIQATNWLIQNGYAELITNDRNILFSLRVENPFEISVQNDLIKYQANGLTNVGAISFSSRDSTPDVFLNFKNLSFTKPNSDYSGEIIFENGVPIWTVKNFKTEVIGINAHSVDGQSFKIQCDLKFFPHRGKQGIYELNNVILMDEKEDILVGNLSIYLDQKGGISRLLSNGFEVSYSLLNKFLFPQFPSLNNLIIKTNHLDWRTEKTNQLALDGQMILSTLAPSPDRAFEIPIKWTVVNEKDQLSHWLKLSYKKNHSSDIEINLVPERNSFTIKGNQISVVDLIDLFRKCIRPTIQNEQIIAEWLAENRKLNPELFFETVLLTPSLELNNFEAEINLKNQSITFQSTFKESLIQGELQFNLMDPNSSELSTFNLQLSGKDTNASILNSFTNHIISMDGLVNWKVSAKGEMNGTYELQSSIKNSNLMLTPLAGGMEINADLLKEGMEKSLGSSFSWSAPQTRMIEVLGNLINEIHFEHGSIKITKKVSGEWLFSLSDLTGQDISLMGSGSLSPTGNFKMNVFPGFKNKWADFLQVANILAAGKARQGYRSLKREPIVIGGAPGRIKLTNWWDLLGQGMGLEPAE